MADAGMTTEPVVAVASGVVDTSVCRPDRSRARIVVERAAILTCATVGTLLLVLPFERRAFTAGLDDSWQAVMHIAWERGLHFGTDIVFTYGPYGFLSSPHYYPATFPIAVALWICVGAVMCWNVWRYVDGFQWPFAGRLVTFAAVVAVLGASASSETVFYIAALLAVARRFHSRPHATIDAALVALGVVLGLGGLVKFSYLVAAGAAAVVISLSELADRRVPCLAVATGASVVGFWLSAGQRLGDFPVFLRRCFDISSGYSEAMAAQRGDAVLGLIEAGLFIGVSLAILTGVLLTRSDGRRSLNMWLHVGVLAAVLFVAFKSRFVRHDARALMAVDIVVLATLLYAPSIVGAVESRAWRYVALVFFVAAPLVLGICSLRTVGGSVESIYGNPAYPVVRLERQIAGAWAAVFRTGSLAEAYASNMASIRAANPLPDVAGQTVDMMSNEQALVLAYGLNYSPRPVFQSYAAYAPSLSALNAEWLSGPRAPQTLLVRAESIDNRYFTLDDSRSWLAMMSNYRVEALKDDWVVMVKRDVPRVVRLVGLGERTAPLGSTVDVPVSRDGRPIWVQIDVRAKPLGALAGILFRPAVTQLNIQSDWIGAPWIAYRLIPAVARDGFLLSPVVSSQSDVSAILTDDVAAGRHLERAQAISVSGSTGVGLCYRSPITYRFYEILDADSPSDDGTSGQSPKTVSQDYRGKERPAPAAG